MSPRRVQVCIPWLLPSSCSTHQPASYPEQELAVVFLWQKTGTITDHDVIPFQMILYDCVRLWSFALDVSLVGPGRCSLRGKCDRNQLAAHKDS